MSEIEYLRVYKSDGSLVPMDYAPSDFGDSDFMEKHYAVWVEGILERPCIHCKVYVLVDSQTKEFPMWVVLFDSETTDVEYIVCYSSYNLCQLLKTLEFKKQEEKE